jgi:hypothetical protein
MDYPCLRELRRPLFDPEGVRSQDYDIMASRYAKMSETRLREEFIKMSDVMKKGREAKQEQTDQAVNS